MKNELINFLNRDLSPSNQVIDVKDDDDGIQAKMLGTNTWRKPCELPYPIMLRINAWKNMGGKI